MTPWCPYDAYLHLPTINKKEYWTQELTLFDTPFGELK